MNVHVKYWFIAHQHIVNQHKTQLITSAALPQHQKQTAPCSLHITILPPATASGISNDLFRNIDQKNPCHIVALKWAHVLNSCCSVIRLAFPAELCKKT